ncbi:hypothetical protein RchiOBHm_Chr6g0247661 [Rosa chinensis]|uniref:SCP domain-containing protein n=1 Tax=Rosa chinensis TaxID=74649 RepID=A0A2P6PJV2_ROSCH|nr:hypothetical protein RchiOBHm_Chr6g0247661 [Rosa chinensis]
MNGFRFKAQNEARAEVGISPLELSVKLAQYAQDYANKRIPNYSMKHSMGPYAENLTSSMGMTGGVAVNYCSCYKYTKTHDSRRKKKGVNQIIIVIFVHGICTSPHLPCPKQPSGLPQRPVAHNAARAQVGVKLLTWSNSLAAYAQQYASKRIADCKSEHSTGPYSENIAEASYTITGTRAMELWVNEKPSYNYQLNKCVGGQCGHYTRVVIWRNSAQVGCARVSNSGWWFVTCNYNPPGNIVGERPY